MKQVFLFVVAICAWIPLSNQRTIQLTRQERNKTENNHSGLSQNAVATEIFKNNQLVNDLFFLTQNAKLLFFYVKLSYIGQIQVGTPKPQTKVQTFYVIFDTGSDVLFIQTLGCSTCTLQPVHSIKYSPAFYKPKDSLTYYKSNSTSSLYYGSLYAFGNVGTETLWLEQQQLLNFQMVFVTQEGSGQQGQAPCYDGIMGLSNSRSSQNIYETGYEQGYLVSSMFAFDLANLLFYFDDIPIQFTNTPSVETSLSSRWTFLTIGLEINGSDQMSSVSYTNTLVDSGTSLILIDQSIINKIASYSNNLIIDQYYNLYSLQCPDCNCPQLLQDFPPISFYSEGAKLTILPTSYFLPLNNKCALGMQANANLGFIILGDNFMRSMVVTYDKSNNLMYFLGENVEYMNNADTPLDSIIITTMSSTSLFAIILLIYQSVKVKRANFAFRK